MGEPQFAMKQTLRGYKNFEDIYQGQPIRYPIYLFADRESQGRTKLAQQAWDSLRAEASKNPTPPYSKNDTGYDPYLLDATSVPLGGNCLLWLPYIAGVGAGDPPATVPVHYDLEWQYTPVSRFRSERESFHDPEDRLGQQDTSVYDGPAAIRQLIVAARETVRFQQDEPIPGDMSNLYGNAVQSLWPLSLRTHAAEQLLAGGLLPNFVPGGAAVQGHAQQGVFKNNPAFAGSSDYVVTDVVAKGDRMLIAVWREPFEGLDPDSDVYDFDTTDFLLSFFFGRCGFSTGQPTLATPLQPQEGLGVFLATGSR